MYQDMRESGPCESDSPIQRILAVAIIPTAGSAVLVKWLRHLFDIAAFHASGKVVCGMPLVFRQLREVTS